MKFRLHVSIILKHLAVFSSCFFWCCHHWCLEKKQLTRKDLGISHVASWILVEEALESILGKAYFAFMCARWAVLFFWEAGWTTETTMDALLRVEGWKVTHGHWQDCTSRWPERKMCNQISLLFLSSSCFTWKWHGKGSNFLGSRPQIPLNHEYGARTKPSEGGWLLVSRADWQGSSWTTGGREVCLVAGNARTWCWDGVVMRMIRKDRSCFKTRKVRRNYLRSTGFHIVSHRWS